jgi:hypothetical protein
MIDNCRESNRGAGATTNALAAEKSSANIEARMIICRSIVVNFTPYRRNLLPTWDIGSSLATFDFKKMRTMANFIGRGRKSGRHSTFKEKIYR